MPLTKVPNKEIYETLWYSYWQEEGLFTPKLEDSGVERDAKDNHFSMILPPPNITGNLHLGHALTVTLQDTIFRWHRMKGDNRTTCVWIPGYDHAGIATQLILDKTLRKQKNLSTKDLSREEFEKFASKWKEDRISDIRNQLKLLGASLDYTREYYTLSSHMSEAVKEAFIRLHDDGLIYRRNGLVNWSFHLKSTLSDIEVDWLHINGPTKVTVPGHSEPVEFGTMHKVAYQISNDSEDREIIIHTTRIETIVGDVAIAVNPSDTRYLDMIGRTVIHPLTGQLLPIIADKRIDIAFGSGAMKVTPSHGLIDYEIGKDHGLPLMNIFDENGCISCSSLREEFSTLNGLSRFSAKQKTREIIEQLGFYRGVEDHKTVVPVCARSGDVIETILLPQWYIKNKLLCDDVRNAVNSGELKIVPENYMVVLLKWLNDSDWCISRQIAWGHQIPAYRVLVDGKDTGTWVAARSEDGAIDKAASSRQISSASISVVQDKDVLDTWFSSALLPFSSLGWPDKSDVSYKKLYPLSLMETGFDIIGFWVARMALLSKRLTGRFAFNEVLLHGMVCDAHGKKMTKSLGNVIDPSHVVNGVTLNELVSQSNGYYEQGLLTEVQLQRAQEGQRMLFPRGVPDCGADALRLSLLKNDTQQQIIRIDVKNIDHNRSFINKMWQTYRFFELHSSNAIETHQWANSVNDLQGSKSQLSALHLWILSRLSGLVTTCNQAMKSHQICQLYAALQQFWLENLCNIYVECIKSSLNPAAKLGNQTEFSLALNVFNVCLRTTLLCAHPLIPFVSEELYQRLTAKTLKVCVVGKKLTSILEEQYPGEHSNESWASWCNPELDKAMEQIELVVSRLRSIIVEFGLNKKEAEEELIVRVIVAKDKVVSFNRFTNVISRIVPLKSIVIMSVDGDDTLCSLREKPGEKEEEEEKNLQDDWLSFFVDEELTVVVKPTDKLVNISLKEKEKKAKKKKTKVRKSNKECL